MASTKYAMADRDAEGLCLAEDVVVEGDDYPYNDDRYTLSPEDFYRVHYHCQYLHGPTSTIGRVMRNLIDMWN